MLNPIKAYRIIRSNKKQIPKEEGISSGLRMGMIGLPFFLLIMIIPRYLFPNSALLQFILPVILAVPLGLMLGYYNSIRLIEKYKLRID